MKHTCRHIGILSVFIFFIFFHFSSFLFHLFSFFSFGKESTHFWIFICSVVFHLLLHFFLFFFHFLDPCWNLFLDCWALW